MKRTKPTKLSKDFRLTVPPEVRKAKGWKPGQVFELVPRSSGVLLVPVKESGAEAGVTDGGEDED